MNIDCFIGIIMNYILTKIGTDKTKGEIESLTFLELVFNQPQNVGNSQKAHFILES